ncbi:polysaccharide export protein [Flavihumibacter sp. R14]|nr:polysaccharide export protein [Flavihumibacter soli]
MRILQIYLSYSFVLTLFLLLTSCGSYRELLYFQNLDHSRPFKENIENFTAVTIQNDDILGINISSLSSEASALFNVNFASNGNTQGQSLGYQVDTNGAIEIPLLGTFKVAGLSTTELRDQIKQKLQKYLKEPIVNVRILNFKVSVMGDVGKPGVYNVENERITLPEAVTLAGDLNVTADRNNLWLIRERDSQREYIPIDLTSKDIFKSPYFYLKNNDLLYIQPGKAKYSSVSNTYQILGIFLSVLSIVAIVITSN